VSAPRRNQQLDVVRAVAILLVLAQHHTGPGQWAHFVGWTGVDLFFVLSGFLVSGLLFDELSGTGGSLDAKRFLIRRGFKIYPAFWAMLIFTVVGFWLSDTQLDKRALVSELLFLQNYVPGLWTPTWSLAVEEHFYFGLALTFALLTRRYGTRWLRRTPATLAKLMLAVLLLRTTTLLLSPAPYKMLIWGTHARVDALLFGTLLSYLYRHRATELASFVNERKGLVLVASLVLITPACTLGNSLPTRTIGITLLYLGFGGFLLLALHSAPRTDPLSRMLAAIGRYSYGIYIWHEPLQSLIIDKLAARSPIVKTVTQTHACYFFTSIVGGVLLSKAIEVPFLRLRDRWFPAFPKARTSENMVGAGNMESLFPQTFNHSLAPRE
jgi:peptidoglycan/LPS O-acetylase OafA/YrhL